MSTSHGEIHHRDVAIELQAELTESNNKLENLELANTELWEEIQVLTDRLRISGKACGVSLQLMEKLLLDISLRNTEIADIRKSHTWRIGSSVLTPVRWVKRSKS